MRQKTTSWQKFRKFINNIHLWLGLISGLVLIFVCLSGTIYTYQAELVTWSEAHLHEVKIPSQAKTLSAAQMLQQIHSKDSAQLYGVQIPAYADESYEFNFSSTNGDRRSNITYYVNPYTAQVLGTSQKKNSMRKFMGYMFSLHRWLLLDKIENPIFGEFPNRKLGSVVTGLCTILFTVGVITGMVIWFPNKLRSWKQDLKIKVGGSWKRTNHDLHNTLGFYSCFILLLMGLTGPFFSFDWYRTGLRKVLGTYEAPKIDKDKTEKREKISENEKKKIDFPINLIEKYVQKTNEILPYQGKIRVGLQKNKLQIYKTKAGFFAPIAGDEISFDVQNLVPNEVKRFSDKKWNQKISSSIKALHMGTVFGGFSKLLYFISCLIATSLPITGTLIWLNKMKKKK